MGFRLFVRTLLSKRWFKQQAVAFYVGKRVCERDRQTESDKETDRQKERDRQR